MNERQSGDKPNWSIEVVQPVLAILSARWVLPILCALEAGPLRRNALRQRLEPVSDKILTETLRRMEANHLVIRTAVATVPVEVDYALTRIALNLWPILHGAQQWVQSIPPEGFGGPDDA